MKHVWIACLLISFQLQAQTETSKKLLTSTDLSVLASKAKANQFSGTLLMVQGKDNGWSWSNGLAQEELKIANGDGVRYNLGSIGKSLTAVLIMQLIEQKKMVLDEPVKKYLPAGTLTTGSDAITIRHLLNNTSGLGDFFESPDYSESKTISIDDHMKLVNGMKPVSMEPGKSLHYSNSGFIVLGKLLELHYGKPYQQIVKERLLQPVGIHYDAKKPIATGYYVEKDSLKIGEGNDPSKWSSAGGLFLTVQELHLLIKGMMDGKLISKESLQRLWTKESRPEQEPPFVHYGLGWMLEDPNCIQLRGHNGGVKGFQAAFRYLPQEDTFIYFLSNRDGGIESIFMETIFLLMERKGCKMEMPGNN
jgi:CubicO group peptidase (beta-lactamase class C family)